MEHVWAFKKMEISFSFDKKQLDKIFNDDNILDKAKNSLEQIADTSKNEIERNFHKAKKNYWYYGKNGRKLLPPETIGKSVYSIIPIEKQKSTLVVAKISFISNENQRYRNIATFLEYGTYDGSRISPNPVFRPAIKKAYQKMNMAMNQIVTRYCQEWQ